MSSSSYLLSFLLLLVLLTIVSSENNDRLILACEGTIINDRGIITNEVDVVLNSLTKNPTQTHLTSIFGLSYCRGDISSTSCSSCLSLAKQRIKTGCPANTADARFLNYDLCYVRLGLQNFIGQVDTSFGRVWNNANDGGNIRDDIKGAYWQSVEDLLLALLLETVEQDTMFRQMNNVFALAKWRINGMAQCSPDLSKDNCEQCLDVAMDNVRKQCMYLPFCEVIYGSCFLMFSTDVIKRM